RDSAKLPRHFGALAIVAIIGLMSGLTGTGGGIFLSPLLILMGWSDARTAAGVSAAFILVNTIAGLLGNLPSFQELPSAVPIWAVAVVIGGFIGSYIGSQKLGLFGLRKLLALVLFIAGGKMVAGF